MDARRSTQQGERGAVCFTAAESRVLPLLATYLTLGGIATRLGVRRSTVKTHVASIYGKLDATSRAQAVERARAEGFISADLNHSG